MKQAQTEITLLNKQEDRTGSCARNDESAGEVKGMAYSGVIPWHTESCELSHQRIDRMGGMPETISI